jgi:transposase
MVDQALAELSPRRAALYSRIGRPSIAPERLIRALLLQILYTIRSERMLMEQLDYNLLFRWFVGLSMDDRVWDTTTFSKNRERLLSGEGPELGALSVDGTLVEAWASQKSFQPRDGSGGSDDTDRGNPTVNFRGQKRSNETHESKTDPDGWRTRGMC